MLKMPKKKNGYSMLEIIATLAIVSIIILMLTNILLVSLDISKKSFARSSLRENQNEV